MSPAFDVPEIRRRAVTRPRLIAELGTIGSRPHLAIVHGSAGSGKSTILAQWASSLELDEEILVWITLNPDDAGVLPFWDRVEGALVRTGVVPTDSPLHAVSRQRLKKTAIRSLLLKGFQTLDAPLTIVLDDYHLVSSEAIDAQLRFLVENLSRVHLVIGSRSTSGLHARDLASLVDTVVLNAGELTFTAIEAQRLVTESPLGANARLAHAIQKASLGWPLAAQALLFERQRSQEQEKALERVAAHRPIFIREFVQTLLLERSATSVEFLLRIALSNECTVRLAAEMTDWSPAETAEQMDALVADGQATWQLRDGIAWFRLHPLLQEALESEAENRLDPETVIRLRGLIADQLQDSRPLRALELAFTIRDWQRVENLVLLQWLAFSYYHRASFVALLRRVPRAAMREHPTLLSAELVQGYGNPHESIGQLANGFATVRAIRGSSDLPSGVLGALAEALTMGVHRLFGDMPTALDCADRALDYLASSSPEEWDEHLTVVPVLLLQTAVTHLLDGQYLRTLEELSRSRGLAEEIGFVCEQLQTLAVTALTHAVRGDIAQADEWISRCEQRDPYDGWLGGYLQTGNHIAKIVRALNNWDAEEANRGLETLNTYEPVTEYWPYIAIAQAQADLILLGPVDAHSRLAATLVRKRWRPTVPAPLTGRLIAMRAQLLLLAGQQERASSAIAHSRLGESPEVDLVRARLLAARGEHDQAVVLAESVGRGAAENPALRAEALLTVAAVAKEAQNLDLALEAFESAIGILSAHELRFPLIMVPPVQLDQLIAVATERGIPLPDDVFLSIPTVAHRLRVVEPLSRAERRVMHALLRTKDLSTVAESLHLSVHTVRYHLKRSYRKLGVSTRAEAISLAQELGVLGEIAP